ncbi:MAG TPA: ABC transporter ATP-binding protein [Hyphomicrobiaceae bacterium]|nr:ABC transporter ATP-binding protein [Hyphomicrobiaceae bacterium]
MSEHLRCENVNVRFGGVAACDGVSLSVEKGKVVGLIGPNGAGKTTLFNVMTRFQDFQEGNLYLNGENINRRQPHEMSGLGLSRTFQNINLFGEQTVLSNILIGSHRLIGNPISSLFWLPGARAREKELIANAVEIASMLGLEDELDIEVKNLAYGSQKRVELARALASRPQIMLLDEPVAGCNDEETAEITNIIGKLNRDLGMTILLVEHDMSMVMLVCDYIHVINFGANLATGTPEEVRTNPDVIRAYLGEDD